MVLTENGTHRMVILFRFNNRKTTWGVIMSATKSNEKLEGCTFYDSGRLFGKNKDRIGR